MESELIERLRKQDEKLEAIWKSVEKTRRYFLIVVWVTVIAFVLPLIGLIFVVPAFLNTYMSSLNGLI